MAAPTEKCCPDRTDRCSSDGTDRCFTDRIEEYSSLVSKNVGSSDLQCDIPELKEFMGEKRYGDVIRVRKGDQLSLFDRSTFATWYGLKQTHPETRAPITFIAGRLEFKRLVSEHLPDLMFKDITDEFRDQWLQDLQKTLKPPEDIKNKLYQQIAIDIGYLERINHIFKGMSVTMAHNHLKDSPTGSWLIRTSSQTSHSLINAQVFTISYKNIWGAVRNVRLVDVHGAGIYDIGTFEGPVQHFSELKEDMLYATNLVEILWNLWETSGIQANLWVLPSE